MKRRFVNGVVGSIVLILFFALDARAGDPKLEYRTIETEHFRIHYHQGLEGVARQAATIFEEVHLDLTILFEWEIDGPTHVVINDSTDRANGTAYATRYPLIRLFATAPTSGSSLQNYDHWLRMLFIHEYTHIISLRINSKFAKIINSLFGYVYLPNTFSPRWYHEGVAVLMETYQTTGGRIRSTNFPMTLRAAMLEGTFPTLGTISNSSRLYPRSTGHYVYGAMFMNYMRDRYGMEKIVQLYHVYGSALLPYGLNRASKDVFGTDLDTIYKQWTAQVKTETESLKVKLEKQGLTESTRITTDGETKGKPIFSQDGKSILMPVSNGMEDTGIFAVPLDGSKSRRLALSNSYTRLSMDRSGRLFYTRSAPFEIHYKFTDVFVLEHPDSEPKRITSGARSWDAAICPRGDLLAMTSTQNGKSKLVLADERGHEIRTLLESHPENQVFAPSWSPDGKTVAVIVRRGPRVDIAIIDVATGRETLVTDDVSIEDTPVFHPSGKYLLYKSSRTGIDNIYAHDLKTGDVFQVTNVLTGAYSPAVSPDGSTLAFVQYSSIGYDLHTMPLNLDSLEPTTQIEQGHGIMRPVPAPSTAQSKPYNPLPSFSPNYWRLNMATNSNQEWQVQALSSLEDATGRHQMAGMVDYDIKETTFSGEAAYSYSGLGPGLHVGFSRQNDPRNSGYTIDGQNMNWVQKVTRGNINLSFPIRGLDRSHSLSAGYTVLHAEPLDEPQQSGDPSTQIPSVPTQYFRTGIELNWSLRDVVVSPLGISPHKGRKLSFRIGLYHPYLGGTQTLASFRYNWTEYVKIPWTKYHVLAIRLNGGAYVSDPPGQASFSIGGYAEQNVVDVIWNNSPAGLPSLRGYEQNSSEGDKFHSLRLEYRLPVWFAEATIGTLPAYLKRIQAGIFTDNVLISFDDFDTDDWRSALGAELVWVVSFSYFRELSIRTGYAHGFMEGGTHEIIMTIGNSF